MVSDLFREITKYENIFPNLEHQTNKKKQF